jgi:hypothetical protein
MWNLRRAGIRLVAIGVVGLATAGAANAQIVLSGGGFGGGSEGTVVDLSQETPFIIRGSLNGAPASLDDGVVISSTEEIINGGQGQATYVPDDGALNNLCVELDQLKLPEYIFDSFTINMQGKAGANTSFTVDVDYILDSDPNTILNTGNLNVAGPGLPLVLGNGENRFQLHASNGYHMIKVCFNAAGGSDYGKQVRIHNLALRFPPQDVPEPGTLAMLGGLAVSGSIFVWRRRRA